MHELRSRRRLRWLGALALLCAPLTLQAAPGPEGDPAPPAPLRAADLSTAYLEDHELVEEARERGLTSGVRRALDEPSTKNDVRVALIDALHRSGRTRDLARTWVRHLQLQHGARDGLTLDDLRTDELLTLGYMIAREQSGPLSPLGGDSEVERADPAAAADRREQPPPRGHDPAGGARAGQGPARPLRPRAGAVRARPLRR